MVMQEHKANISRWCELVSEPGPPLLVTVSILLVSHFFCSHHTSVKPSKEELWQNTPKCTVKSPPNLSQFFTFPTPLSSLLLLRRSLHQSYQGPTYQTTQLSIGLQSVYRTITMSSAMVPSTILCKLPPVQWRKSSIYLLCPSPYHSKWIPIYSTTS